VAENSSSIDFYPQGDQVNTQTDVLAATTDGKHILGASVTGSTVTLSDIGVTIPSTLVNGIEVPDKCQVSASGVLSPLIFSHTLNQITVGGVQATSVNQIVPSPASNLAFLTYTGTTPGATLPYYVPSSTSGSTGTLHSITLNGGSAVTAPLTGAFSPDSTLFFVSTAGDNLIHEINVQTLKDTLQIAPALPACLSASQGGNDLGCTYTGTGSIVPTTAIAIKPRPTT
jgi:hypothetical protein